MEVCFTIENYGTMEKQTMVLWKNLWYYGQNYGSMDNSMVLYRELRNIYLKTNYTQHT